eukprot:m51a1_g14590 putative major facilitator superfamily transporter (548) ;mRNA; r:1149764-1151477
MRPAVARVIDALTIFPEGVSKKQLIPVLLLHMSESFSMSGVTVYAGTLVLEFMPGMSAKAAGYYAGLLASSFFLFQFVSSPVLGRLSDRMGRRPLLLVGTAGNLLCSVAIGLSWNFWWAVAVRSLNGLLNGNIAVIKSLAADISPTRKTRARVFSDLLLATGIGSAVGSATGGILCTPARKWPAVFAQTGLFGRFPFLLPSLATTSVLAAALISSWMWLRDPMQEAKASGPVRLQSIESGHADSADTAALITANGADRERRGEECENEEQQQDAEASGLARLEKTALQRAGDTQPADIEKASLLQSASAIADSADPEEGEQHQRERQRPKTICSRDNSTSLTLCGMYAFYGMAANCFHTVMPVWVLAPVAAGGLSMTSSAAGAIFSIAGVLVIPLQLLLYPQTERRIGLLWTFRVGCVLSIASYCLAPGLSLLFAAGVGTTVRWLCVAAFCVVWTCGSQFGFGGSYTLLANSTVAETRGSITGIAQGVSSLLRAFSPAPFAAFVAWGLLHSRATSALPFAVISLMSALMLLLSFVLPKSLDSPLEAK